MKKVLQFRITGESPLIMHNGQLADPLNEISKKVKAISGKRSKTDEDYENMARLEWYGSLYVQNGRVILPGMNIEALFINAARKLRMGKTAQASVTCPDDPLLLYDGPEDIDELWKSGEFRLTVGVRIKGSRVMRTRPIFHEWAAEFTIEYDEAAINEEDVIRIMGIAGEKIGLCDWRPKFGLFSVKVIE